MIRIDNSAQVTPKVGKCYTLSEALEFERQRNKYPTQGSISWVDCKTGKPVAIGCTKY